MDRIGKILSRQRSFGRSMNDPDDPEVVSNPLQEQQNCNSENQHQNAAPPICNCCCPQCAKKRTPREKIEKIIKDDRFLFISTIKHVSGWYLLYPSSLYVILLTLFYGYLGLSERDCVIYEGEPFGYFVISFISVITNSILISSKVTRSTCLLIHNTPGFLWVGIRGGILQFCDKAWSNPKFNYIRRIDDDDSTLALDLWDFWFSVIFEIPLLFTYILAIMRIGANTQFTRNEIDFLKSTFMLIYSLDFDFKLNYYFVEYIPTSHETRINNAYTRFDGYGVKTVLRRVRTIFGCSLFVILGVWFIYVHEQKCTSNKFLENIAGLMHRAEWLTMYLAFVLFFTLCRLLRSNIPNVNFCKKLGFLDAIFEQYELARRNSRA